MIIYLGVLFNVIYRFNLLEFIKFKNFEAVNDVEDDPLVNADHTRMHCWQWSFFQNLINLFLGYFDPINNFFDNKKNIFRGYLGDISAETASLTAG